MKKIISIILVVALVVFAFAACGKKNNENEVVEENQTVAENNEAVEDGNEAENGRTEEADKNPEVKPEVKPEAKPQAKPETKPETKPEAKPEVKPESKPEAKPEVKPEAKPEVKPEPKPEASTPSTLGNTLLADFKVKAASMNTLALAEALITNPVIQFSGGAMPVEPGLLSGFGNTEITGFKEGAVFMPMIGSIAFVGYVFELENAADVSGFIAKLRSSADMRWNICVEAEEMVTGSVGTKVFFVMCPTSLEG